MSNNKYKVLIIEDEQNINNLLDTLMQANGYQTIIATSCGSGLMMYASHRPDIVILDLGLPDKDGISFLTEIRKTDFTPVIVLSARSDEKDKVEALNLGANDYVTKPFGMMELVSRVRALLRRAAKPAAEDKLFTAGSLAVDVKRRAVTVDGEPVILTYKEFELLCYLLENRGVVLSRDQILTKIWDYNYSGETRTVDVHIRTLRQKLGDAGALIETVRGVGYRLAQD